jgi:hypothetical protein
MVIDKMKHLKALLIKFVMSAVVLGIVLTGIYNYDFSDIMLISLVLTVVAYALGDLLVYRNAADDSDYKKRNIVATISDLILSFLVIWINTFLILIIMDIPIRHIINNLLVQKVAVYLYGYFLFPIIYIITTENL